MRRSVSTIAALGAVFSVLVLVGQPVPLGDSYLCYRGISIRAQFLPAFVSRFGVAATMAQFFGGTSLLIMVGVALDTVRQMESHLLMRHYDGFLKKGRMRGRF
mgnify:CR=1 FL=1